ncbi:MAG: MmcB family DNA repair protein [Helicobacteraceae bacterium]|nr:MmcB family DNA repair protein [Helicobacteraceae bacterium]
MKIADLIKSSIIQRRGLKGHMIVDEVGLPLNAYWENTYYADVFEITKDNKIIIYEVKSSKQDYRSDKKWKNYLQYCEYFYFVAPREVIEIIKNEVPKHVGLYTYEKDYLECIRASRRHNKDLVDKETVKNLNIKIGYRFASMHSKRKKEWLEK